jgi:nitrous oxidase accessory protein NosD
MARRILAASALIVCLAFTVGSARADADKLLLLSFDEFFTGNTTIDGTTTLSGAFSDKGDRHQDNTILSVSSDGTQVVVTGTVTINGSKGILTTQYTGTIQFDATNIAYVRGTEIITGGTGIYAGAKGSGTFEASLDFDTGNIRGVAEFLSHKTNRPITRTLGVPAKGATN